MGQEVVRQGRTVLTLWLLAGVPSWARWVRGKRLYTKTEDNAKWNDIVENLDALGAQWEIRSLNSRPRLYQLDVLLFVWHLFVGHEIKSVDCNQHFKGIDWNRKCQRISCKKGNYRGGTSCSSYSSLYLYMCTRNSHGSSVVIKQVWKPLLLAMGNHWRAETTFAFKKIVRGGMS